MWLSRWNWLSNLRQRRNSKFASAPRPSKFTRRRRLYEVLGAVEGLEQRLQLSAANPTHDDDSTTESDSDSGLSI